MTLPAGPELDRLVAEKVMGWRPKEIGGSLIGYGDRIVSLTGTVHAEGGREITFMPSGNISHAFEVAERMKPVALELWWDARAQWWCALFRHEDKRRQDALMVTADTAPHAICLAALEATTSR